MVRQMIQVVTQRMMIIAELIVKMDVMLLILSLFMLKMIWARTFYMF